MGFDTYYKLAKILKKRGPHSFGRICQYLLEISLMEIQFSTRGRAVERPDIIAERNRAKYAIECKYQKGNEITLTKRDLDGVMDFESSDFIPLIAFLWMDINASWAMVKANRIKPGKSNKTALKIYEILELSDEINSVFPRIVDENFELALNRGSEGIRSKIK